MNFITGTDTLVVSRLARNLSVLSNESGGYNYWGIGGSVKHLCAVNVTFKTYYRQVGCSWEELMWPKFAGLWGINLGFLHSQGLMNVFSVKYS